MEDRHAAFLVRERLQAGDVLRGELAASPRIRARGCTRTVPCRRRPDRDGGTAKHRAGVEHVHHAVVGRGDDDRVARGWSSRSRSRTDHACTPGFVAIDVGCAVGGPTITGEALVMSPSAPKRWRNWPMFVPSMSCAPVGSERGAAAQVGDDHLLLLRDVGRGAIELSIVLPTALPKQVGVLERHARPAIALPVASGLASVTMRRSRRSSRARVAAGRLDLRGQRVLGLPPCRRPRRRWWGRSRPSAGRPPSPARSPARR